MSGEKSKDLDDHFNINVDEIVDVFDSLPIVARLEFVKRIIFARGGDKDSSPLDPALLMAFRMVDGVIRDVEALPDGPKLGGLDC